MILIRIIILFTVFYSRFGKKKALQQSRGNLKALYIDILMLDDKKAEKN